MVVVDTVRDMKVKVMEVGKVMVVVDTIKGMKAKVMEVDKNQEAMVEVDITAMTAKVTEVDKVQERDKDITDITAKATVAVDTILEAMVEGT